MTETLHKTKKNKIQNKITMTETLNKTQKYTIKKNN